MQSREGQFDASVTRP
nr:unnamed protein product [Callosobruchus chinensis]